MHNLSHCFLAPLNFSCQDEPWQPFMKLSMVPIHRLLHWCGCGCVWVPHKLAESWVWIISTNFWAITRKPLASVFPCFYFFSFPQILSEPGSVEEKSLLKVRMATVTQSTFLIDPYTCKGGCLWFFSWTLYCAPAGVRNKQDTLQVFRQQMFLLPQRLVVGVSI